MTSGLLSQAGRIVHDGGPGLWAVSCGACLRVSTLPRGLSREDAAATARREGWTFFDPLGWTCSGCRFGMGVAPIPTAPRGPKRAEAAPWRRVVMKLDNVRDGTGRRLGPVGELLSCGHTFIPRDGTLSGNRRRRCLDCLHVEGAGSVT